MKIRIIDYKAYEYQLLQDILDDMTDSGYTTDSIGFITFFHKTSEKERFIVDVFQSTAESRFDRNTEMQKFFDPYLDQDYEPIYSKRGLYIFKGKSETSRAPWKKDKHLVSFKRFWYQLLTLFISTSILIGSLVYLNQYVTLDSFLSYGNYFILIGLFIGLITIVLRNLLNTICTYQFKNKKDISIKRLPLVHYIYHVLLVVCCVCLVGGLIEDTFNTKQVTLEEYPLVTLKDLKSIESSEVSYSQQSSFEVEHFYQYLETSNDDVLYYKIYELNSTSKADELFNYYYNNPTLYGCDYVEKDENIIQGFDQEGLMTCMIFLKDQQVQLVSTSFGLNIDQIVKLKKAA